MTSAGYYCDVVLPRELARSRRYASRSVRITRPIGEHPALPAMVLSLVEQRLHLDRLAAQETSFVLVGHGTRRHHHSRQATLDLVAKLRRLATCHEVLPAFLDDVPGVDTILARSTGRNLVVMPFLISGGWHATRDIPAAVGLDGSAGSTATGMVDGRFVVCEPAIGTHPDIADLVAELAAGTSDTSLANRPAAGGVLERIA